MDALTLMIAQLNFPIVTWIAAMLDNDVVMVITTLLLVLATERRKEKVAKIALAILLAVILGTVVKDVVKIDRPCLITPAKIACPASYSFPSGHTLVAFTVMLAFLNKPSFVFYMFYAVFVAFTRIYLGVHSFEDVAGSIALAPFVYYAADKAWKLIEEKKYAFRTEPRQ
ncbi:Undecaprenyl-diphosphatase [uncultured archaeon]|nr:Undecaprenyl-diphosphatase [uncultured archaeon]